MNPEYQLSIVSLCDVLGFSALVRASDDPILGLEILRHLRNTSQPDPDIAALYEKQFIHFSDMFMRITNIRSETNLRRQFGIVFDELNDLMLAQINLVANGVFVRGAVVVGDILHHDEMTLGPALVDAHLFEKSAIQPRIVVCNCVPGLVRRAQLLQSVLHTPEDEVDYVRDLLCQFEDGIWFIDYLRGAYDQCDEFEYPEFLATHAAQVRHNLVTARDKRVREKYEWLARYHNQVVGEYPDQFFDYFEIPREDLLIGE